MGLRDIEASLPPGFRFYPSDQELVCHYLFKKITNEEVVKGTLVEIDLHTCEPWHLPEVAKLNTSEWYFFSFRDRKYATGYRANRATTSGYWKATGKDRTIRDPRTRAVAGMRKTLVFYRNRAPNGIKTGWIMHEFRIESPHMPPREDWVLCRVFHKSQGSEDSSNSSTAALSPQNVFESSPYSPISYFAAAAAAAAAAASSPQPHDQTFLCGQYHQTMLTSTAFSENPPPYYDRNPSSCTLQSLINPSFLQLSQDLTKYSSSSPPVGDIDSVKCNVGHGLLFDMGFEESSNLGEMMGFEDDDDHGSLVFL